VPSQQRRLTANSIQSPYSYRASGLPQIAVSALLRTSSIGARELLAAEHCRYGTRDNALIDVAHEIAEPKLLMPVPNQKVFTSI
jgi:hypothetical protein